VYVSALVMIKEKVIKNISGEVTNWFAVWNDDRKFHHTAGQSCLPFLDTEHVNHCYEDQTLLSLLCKEQLSSRSLDSVCDTAVPDLLHVACSQPVYMLFCPLQDGNVRFVHLASVCFVLTCTAEQSWHCAGEMLIRARLFHLPELDAQLVRMISADRSNSATDLAVHLVRTCLVGDSVVTAADLFNTLDTLPKIARHSSNGPAVLMLVEQARQVTRSASSVPHLFAAFW